MALAPIIGPPQSVEAILAELAGPTRGMGPPRSVALAAPGGPPY